MAVADVLLTIAPKFAEVSPSQRNGIIAIAETLIGANHPQRELSVAYMSAHMLEMAERGGSGGVISSESEGELSRSYAVTANAEYLESTSYGAALKQIRRSMIFAARTRLV